jgi:T-complex protein 1 subunit eta
MISVLSLSGVAREQEDMMRVARATGAVVQTSLSDLSVDVLGTCSRFEERQVGDERFNFVLGCKQAKSCSIILRGGAEQFIAEVRAASS